MTSSISINTWSDQLIGELEKLQIVTAQTPSEQDKKLASCSSVISQEPAKTRALGSLRQKITYLSKTLTSLRQCVLQMTSNDNSWDDDPIVRRLQRSSSREALKILTQQVEDFASKTTALAHTLSIRSTVKSKTAKLKIFCNAPKQYNLARAALYKTAARLHLIARVLNKRLGKDSLNTPWGAVDLSCAQDLQKSINKGLFNSGASIDELMQKIQDWELEKKKCLAEFVLDYEGRKDPIDN